MKDKPTPKKYLNHELIGKRVGYKGRRYLVTGARSLSRGRGSKFRLLDYENQREFWTEQGPSFS
jgi:hypothetical protein